MSKNMAKVVQASFDELPAVCMLCQERALEFNFDGFPPPDTESIIDTVYNSYRQAPCFLLKNNDDIIGAAGLMLDTYGWNKKEPFLCDYMVYIKPPYRNIKLADMLETAIIEFADFHGLRLHRFYIAVDRLDARHRFMRRHGYHQTGFVLSR